MKYYKLFLLIAAVILSWVFYTLLEVQWGAEISYSWKALMREGRWVNPFSL